MDRVDVLLGFNAEMHETLLRQGHTVAIFDDDPDLPPGVPCVGTWDQLPAWFEAQQNKGVALRVVLGVAATAAGRERARKWAINNLPVDFRWGRVISEKAIISSSAILGEGASVSDGAYVGPRVQLRDLACVIAFGRVYHDSIIGEGSVIVGGAAVMGKSKVGRRCHICAGATVLPYGDLADDVTVGAGGSCRRVH